MRTPVSPRSFTLASTGHLSGLARVFAIALLGAVATAGCDGCQDVVTPINDDDGDLPIGELEHRVLGYVGDDPYALFQGDLGELHFTWKTATGLPVAGDNLDVSVAGDAAAITPGSYITDVGGGIAVAVAATNNEGHVTVKVQATDIDGTIQEVVVTVRVDEDPAANLVVTVESEARIAVTSATVRVLAGSNPPTCESLLNGSPAPNAQATATFTPIPSTQEFANMPTGATAVVLADGLNADGVIVARGCSSLVGMIGGVDNDVTVVLNQDPTVLEGDYDVLMHMYLGDALPSPYDETVDLITALLADPAGYALFIALREVDRFTGFTSFVTRDGVEMRYRDLEADPANFPTWSFAREELDQLLTNQLGQVYTDVTNVGAGIRDVVSDFEVGARFTLENSDTENGLIVSETWRDMVLYWPLPCADGDLACARIPLNLEDAELAPVTTVYAATWQYEPIDGHIERFPVTTDAHGLNIRYGAFLLAILEQVVFPSLPEGVAGDSFGDVLTNLVGCTNIAASLFDDPTAQSFVETVCEGALNFAGQQIEEQLIGLQIDATNPELGEEGLSSGGTLALYDDDADLVTEIVDEYNYNVGWYYPNDPSASDDISAPITGAGVRDRLDCSSDDVCADAGLAGFVCAPQPHYLEIARIDLGCSRAKGDLTGGTVCTGDSQCASNLCAPVGIAGALQCFNACDEITDCGAGQVCNAVGGALDLDDVLDGLGSASASGCTAP